MSDYTDKLTAEARAMLDVLVGRASVRNYDSTRRLDAGMIKELLSTAMHAPNTGNMQLYSVVVTMDKDNLLRMHKLHLSQPMARDCGALLTFCADLNRFGRWCRISATRSGLNNAHGLLLSVIDAVIFAQQFVTAAECAGLGTCYLGTVTYNLPAFIHELRLPERVLPLFSIATGYPAEAKSMPTERLPIDAVMHFEHYNDASDDEIRQYYAATESREDSARYVAENGKQNLAQVFSEVRYPQAVNDKISADLLEYYTAVVKH